MDCVTLVRKSSLFPVGGYPQLTFVLPLFPHRILLQKDVRGDVYKLLTEWSIALHKEAGFPYTQYPAG